jgi:hypothetical protein
MESWQPQQLYLCQAFQYKESKECQTNAIMYTIAPYVNHPGQQFQHELLILS